MNVRCCACHGEWNKKWMNECDDDVVVIVSMMSLQKKKKNRESNMILMVEKLNFEWKKLQYWWHGYLMYLCLISIATMNND